MDTNKRFLARPVVSLLACANALSLFAGIRIASTRLAGVDSPGAAGRGGRPEGTTPGLRPDAAATPRAASRRVHLEAPEVVRPSRRFLPGSPPPAVPIAGKGMWIYQFDRIGGGNPHAIAAAAERLGLSHLYVRAGSSRSGLSGWKHVAAVLPPAHARGIKVIAWDFPYLDDVEADVRRALWVLQKRVRGHRVDGFAADVETRVEGTNLTRARARAYGRLLRRAAPDRFLILVAPRPTGHAIRSYPYDSIVPWFDAVAPMVYWGYERAATATADAIAYLRRFRKPLAPIGQAYDMGPEGGPKGHPAGISVLRFMQEAERRGAVGVSFWSWQHAPRPLWLTIRSYPWRLRGAAAPPVQSAACAGSTRFCLTPVRPSSTRTRRSPS